MTGSPAVVLAFFFGWFAAGGNNTPKALSILCWLGFIVWLMVTAWREAGQEITDYPEAYHTSRSDDEWQWGRSTER